jgi:lysozyme
MADDDPVLQANFFLSVVGSQAGSLPPVLDWETFSASPLLDTEHVLTWLQEVEDKSGVTPIIYGSPDNLGALDLDARFLRYPLWVAQYSVATPRVPAPWETWRYWQYTDKGNLSGISGPCDLSFINGTLP